MSVLVCETGACMRVFYTSNNAAVQRDCLTELSNLNLRGWAMRLGPCQECIEKGATTIQITVKFLR